MRLVARSPITTQRRNQLIMNSLNVPVFLSPCRYTIGHIHATEVQSEVSNNILEEQRATTRVYNRKHLPGVSLDLGEMVVMLKAPAVGQPSEIQRKPITSYTKVTGRHLPSS